MQTSFKIAIESEINPDDMNVVIGGLTAYNASQTGGDTPRYF
jgi:hypothetical protein